MKTAEGLVKFLNEAHSAYHAIAAVKAELRDAGFVELFENQPWKLENNRYYYVTRNDSSLVAFKIPEMIRVRSLNIAVSHSDSPCLKLKPQAQLSDDHYSRLSTQVYGGAIDHTWLDRPLSIAGRAVVKQDGRLVSRLVDFGEDYAIIPSVAIHQDRQINDGHKWNAQTDLVAMAGPGGDPNFLMTKLAGLLETERASIMASDLFLYSRQPAYLWGPNSEFITAPRLDDLENAYATLQAFKYSYSENAVNFYCVFDNEEVGSVSRQGAASDFLKDVISRLYASFFYNQADASTAMANAMMVSADNAHACHPNHPELYDEGNRVYMNMGLAIKTSASPAYVTDAVTAALMKEFCDRARVPYQFYADRADLKGGSTQGAIMSMGIAARAVDIGLPQLAMHSSCETAGCQDAEYLVAALTEFYNSAVVADGSSVIILH